MADLPKFYARPNSLSEASKAIGLPRVSEEAYGASAFKAALATAQVFQIIGEKELEATSDELVTGARLRLGEKYADLKNTSDHTNLRNNVELAITEEKGEIERAIKQMPTLSQTTVKRDFDRLAGRVRLDAVDEEGKLRVQHLRAGTLTSVFNYAKIAAQATTPEERQEWESKAFQKLESVGGTVINDFEKFQIGERVKKQIIEERAKYFTTQLSDRLDEFTNRALRDPENTPEYFRQGKQEIDKAAADWLPKEDLAKVHSDYMNKVWYYGAKGKVDDDPAGTLARLKAGHFDKVLDTRHISALRNEAENEIEKRKRDAEAQSRAYERQIGKEVDDFKAASMAGFPWAGNLAALSQKVRGTEHEAEFREVMKNAHELYLFNQMGPAEQESYLRTRSQLPKTGDEAKLFGKLESAHQETKTQLKADPMSFAIKRRVIPDPGPLDLNNPASMKGLELAAGLVEERYRLPTISPLSDDQANWLKAQIAAAPADGKVQIYRKLQQGFGDDRTKAIAAQFAGKQDMTLALTMGLATESQRAASDIIQGRELIARDPKNGLIGAELTTARNYINSQFGEAYAKNPEHHSTMIDAALAAYAQKAWTSGDRSGVFDSSRMQEAIKEVTGGLLSIGGGFFSRGYKIQPPRYGMTEAEFKDLIAKADYSKVKGIKKADILSNGVFESVGDGKYLIKIGPGYVQADNAPFVLDLGALQRSLSGAKVNIGGAAEWLK